MRFGAVLLALCLAACNTPAQTTQSPDATPTSTAVPATVTPTAAPEAARVNGQAILLQEYQTELARFEAAMAELGIELATLDDYPSEVLSALIERKLLAQAAVRLGAELSDSELEQRYQLLVQQRGGAEAMAEWLNTAGYTDDGFRAALREELLAAHMIQTISEGVSAEVEQLHARHILVATEDEAQDMLVLLQGGAEFDQLARIYSLDGSSRPAGGDLGWFARGSLTAPELEQAAFELQAGDVSGVIASSLGYHVIEVLERDRRPLAGNALIDYRSAAIEDWLEEQRQAAAIELFVEP